jgi:uncharacterized protein YdeI (YjbR/CyaY-like superfamily)
MSHRDKRIDVYINKSEDFAKPILIHLRQIIHEACPEVTETIKWSSPHFEYKDSILCSMASFKKHCAFAFWLRSAMKDPHQVMVQVGEQTSMGHFGALKVVNDLPSKKIMITYILEAMSLIDKGIKLPRKKRETSTKEIVVPDYFLRLLKKNKKALVAFEAFSYSRKKEYVEWIGEAKTDTTRDKRIAIALAWLSEGKSMNWKYTK